MSLPVCSCTLGYMADSVAEQDTCRSRNNRTVEAPSLFHDDGGTLIAHRLSITIVAEGTRSITSVSMCNSTNTDLSSQPP